MAIIAPQRELNQPIIFMIYQLIGLFILTLLTLSLIVVVDNLKNLEIEVEMHTASVIDGNLSVRGNANKFLEKYKVIVAGFNHTLDAAVNHLGCRRICG